MVLFQNWGPNLDGASLVTAIIKVEGRDVAVYGHDFTVRAGLIFKLTNFDVFIYKRLSYTLTILY
jgi:acetyl-CoA carboxylase carboxyltransferase component